MNRTDAFKEINSTQDYYVNELIQLINSPEYETMKRINFTSATGTGKTKMMAKLINKLPHFYFIITTLSKGQLHIQIRSSIQHDCANNNFYVYGSADYRINSKLDAQDIIDNIPTNMPCIWLRDEGHIKTNRFDEVLANVCYKIINISATNIYSDIKCNFAQTMMLRSVNQTVGRPEDAIAKLIEVKQAHENIPNYNPCAIFRCVGNDAYLYEHIVFLCEKNNLKWIDITNDDYVMAELCEDNNEYDVIINKFKIVEGIDIRRAHVLYMDNQPENNATTIQVIGRCRRNALLYRNDIDIFLPENKKLLEETRECFVFYNVKSMNIDSDENGELYYAFCDHISCEDLKPNSTIQVTNGQLPNGLYIIELENKTGTYTIKVDPNTGFNTVSPLTDFYAEKKECSNNYYYTMWGEKIKLANIYKLPLYDTENTFNYEKDEYELIKCEPYYKLISAITLNNCHTEEFTLSKKAIDLNPLLESFLSNKSVYTHDYIDERIANLNNVCFLDEVSDRKFKIPGKISASKTVNEYISINKEQKGYKKFCALLENILNTSINLSDEGVFPTNDTLDTHALYLICYYLIEYKERRKTYETLWDSEHRFNKVLDNIKSLTNSNYHSAINWNVVVYISMNPDNKDFLLKNNYQVPVLTCERDYDKEYSIDESTISDYFGALEMRLTPTENNLDKIIFYPSKELIVNTITSRLQLTEENLRNNCIDKFIISYNALFERINSDEMFMLRNKHIHALDRINKSDLALNYKEYTKTINDKESSTIGVDLMRPSKTANNEVIWTEAKTVTAKISNHNKFNSYISNKYKNELAYGRQHCFKGKNSFNLDKRCNSALGYCVEYYSKYLVYGESYLNGFIQKALDEAYPAKINDTIIVRACMLKYRQMMINCFGTGVSKVIKTISISQLIQDKYKYFVELVIELGTKTANYVKKTLYDDRPTLNNIDPNLTIQHISGLADYITEDIILDVKVTNNIDEKYLRQILAYHYLSTKRTDLYINKVIVYDAVSDKAVVIDIDETNRRMSC
ncbi:Type III restriction enzyme, res subunit [Pseudobutyrivibrio sp. C4]|uniref:DEAD/DEAH box helicase family protein n=1 Tax=Pseudobutyrivibrio sp. C4 TaxID=1520803 RepID=UPI0008B668F8|nr:DEAD/DEAH box helicase family protein [Pseudobutyrivibrio sp. C4]SES89045.1 Type III restriction enzyme, res subunit [Pseudobutyrivibrio sp. C4]